MNEEQIFLDALELASPAERSAFLDGACGRDGEVRRHVENLLAAHFRPSPFLNQSVAEQLESSSTSPHSNPRESVEAEQAAVEKAKGQPVADLYFLQPSRRTGSLGRIGHYEILEVLGRGGFGIVFRAFDDVLQRVVAVKVLAPAIAATSPARKRFLREARSSAQVRQENVVHVYAVEEEPLPYLVMEFVPGETLQQRLDRTGPLEVQVIVWIGRQIAEGLAAAHATGLIHRDIKPGNVLIEGDQQRVKITDFGLARAADDASLTQSAVLAGTPMYMAPEQAKGAALDHRADLFSLGSVLYVMATGRPPFRAATTYAVLKRVVEDTPRPIRDLIREMPQWLSDVIAKLQAKNPDDRFQSAREVADTLANLEARLKANASVNILPQIVPDKRVAPRSNGWKWIVATALLAFVLILGTSGIIGNPPWSGTPQAPLKLRQNGDGNDVPGPQTDRPGFAVNLTNSLGMKFNFIPAGRFRMGSSAAEISQLNSELKNDGFAFMVQMEAPDHEVEITQPFYIGVTEVTVRQFREFVVANPQYDVGDQRWKSPDFPQSDNHPVTWVSWLNADKFCSWLSEKDGRRYRLPTEAEWEYCCRAGKPGTRYCFGNDNAELPNYACYREAHAGGTRPVGEKLPNAWNLYDMHGNVFEFCQDWHDPDYYQTGPVQSPQGPAAGANHVFRGGSWSHGFEYCRSAFRTWLAPNERRNCVGFRVVLVPIKQ